TRSKRDWSSDVCSSDLKGGTDGIFRATGTNAPNPGTLTQLAFVGGGADGIALEQNPANPAKPFLYVNRNDGTITRIDTSTLPPRSEERRVGEEFIARRV